MLAMLRPDVEYRLAHHADLTWEPQRRSRRGRVRVTCSTTTVSASSPRRDRPSARSSRLSATASSTTAAAVVIAGDTVSLRGPRRVVPRCRRLRPDGAPRRSRAHGAVPALRRHDRLPLHRDAGRPDRRRAPSVGTLVLTHQIPTPAAGSADEWIAIARRALRRRDRLRRRPDDAHRLIAVGESGRSEQEHSVAAARERSARWTRLAGSAFGYTAISSRFAVIASGRRGRPARELVAADAPVAAVHLRLLDVGVARDLVAVDVQLHAVAAERGDDVVPLVVAVGRRDC